MSVEENGHREVPARGDSGEETSFDNVVRGVATGTLSRRKALRLLGAALAGSVLGSVPGVAWAVPPADRGGRACVGLCSALFGNGGSLFSQCVSGAAQGTGPVLTCAGGCTNTLTDINNCGRCGNVCPASTNFCLQAACLSGTCGFVPANEGLACDDLNACTTGETCQQGVCTGGTVKTCPAGQVCVPATGACVCSVGVTCGTNCCTANEVCCAAGTTHEFTCRGNVTACNAGGGGGGCPAGQSICGGTCCPNTNACCGGTCCATAGTCFRGNCPA